MKNGEKQESIETILEYFPNAQAVILSGSAVDSSFIENVSDIDLLIVGDKDGDIQEKLKKLQERLGEKYDTHFITPENLSTNFVSICPDREYTYHGLDIYRLKNQNKVIYGGDDILKTIPNISFEDALKDILPYVKENIIPKLRKELEEAEDINAFLLQELSQFLVVVRTMYSVKTGKMTSKIAALDYLITEYPSFSGVAEKLKNAYLKQGSSGDVNAIDLNKLLDEADRLFA